MFINNASKKLLLLFVGLAFVQFAFAQVKVLHYDETTGYDHNTRNQSFALFTSLGNVDGYTVVQDSDGSEFTIAKLADYDLVIFSNTSGAGGLNASQKAALEWYIDDNGGSLMGIHAASDTYRHSSANGGSTGNWDWFAETLGGSVQQSPNHTSSNHVNFINDLIVHPSIENMTFPWEKEEEYYYWENGYLNSDIVQIFEVEETGGNSYDEARPMAWLRTNDAGAKIFYTALGHKQGNYTGDFPQFEQLIKDAVLWLLDPSPLLDVSWGEIFAIANSREKTIEVNWSTLQEINVDYFELQRSSNTFKWETIGKINSEGDSNFEKIYSIVDKDPYSEGAYYRVKEVDLDSKFNYSKTVYASFENQMDVSIYPNPCRDRLVLALYNPEQEKMVQIYSNDLKLVKEYYTVNEEELDIVVKDLGEGMYILKIFDLESNNTLAVYKFLKH